MFDRFIRSLGGSGFLLCVLLTASPGVLRAQVTATILGSAKDGSGAVLPRVKVTATNTETNFVQEGYTSVTGELTSPSKRSPSSVSTNLTRPLVSADETSKVSRLPSSL